MSLSADDERKIGVLFDYFDNDCNGLVQQSEFERMLVAVTLGRKMIRGLYSEACKRGGVKIKKGLNKVAFSRLYESSYFDLEEHFAAFQQTRALPEDPHLLRELKVCSNPKHAPRRIDQVNHLCDGTCIILIDKKVFLFEDGSLIELISELKPEWIGTSQLLDGRPVMLLFEDGEFKVFEICRSKKSGPTPRIVRSLGGFPKHWGDVDEDEDDEGLWSACLDVHGKLHIAALILETSKPSFALDGDKFTASEEDSDADDKGHDDDDDEEEEPPDVFSERRKCKVLVAYHAGTTVDICDVPPRACNIQISNNGEWCSFGVHIGEALEEASRGEWYVCRLRKGESPQKISEGPIGRIPDDRPARFSPSDKCIVYQANHTESHPITRHMDLWLVNMQDGAMSSPRKLTPGSMQIDAFDWVPGNDDLIWVSGSDGIALGSFQLTVPTSQLKKVEPAAAYECLPSWNPTTGKAVYAVESMTEFMGLWDGSTSKVTRLTQFSEKFEDVICDRVQWDGPGGARVWGAVYYSSRTPSIDRTLLVWIHGGPTCSWPIRRHAGLNANEFNFLALLRVGYLVFVPLYRGTLGFGDQWSMSTIDHMGSSDGDLGDILTGVAHLQKTGLHGCSTRAGIFGESYGGYMTIRAMSDPQGLQIFQCGVAWYGYVSNRETTLLTGDFTWESEFFSRGPDIWPPPELAADSFVNLGNIQGPLLLCHGDEDDACPISHSEMVYRSLRRRGIPTDFVIYPGMGHGFHGDKVAQDAHWRTLQWFLRHLPPHPPSAECQSEHI